MPTPVTPSSTNAPPTSKKPTTEQDLSTIWFKVKDNNNTPIWQYSTTENGNYTDCPDDGLEDIFSQDEATTSVVAKVHNKSGHTIYLTCGANVNNQKLDDKGQINFSFPVPPQGKSSDTYDDYAMTATYSSGATHDPTFYIKRSGTSDK